MVDGPAAEVAAAVGSVDLVAVALEEEEPVVVGDEYEQVNIECSMRKMKSVTCESITFIIINNKRRSFYFGVLVS